MSLLGFGARSLVPDELLEGWGYDAISDTWLIRPGIPLLARFERQVTYPSPATGSCFLAPSGVPWGGDPKWGQYNRMLIWQSAYDAVIRGIGRVGDTAFPNPHFKFIWRPAGSPDSTAWTEIPGQYLAVSFNSTDGSTITSGTRFVQVLGIEDRRLDPTSTDFDAGTAALPTTDQEIEFFLLGPHPPDEHHPVLIDGITDGELTKNAYDGLYSSRDPDTGAVVATGIRYDEDAVLLMDNPVRFLLDKPIEDLRDWTEKHVYGVNGWSPALDDQGRISPVHRAPPADVSGLTIVTNDDVEPGPAWTAGNRVINRVRFKYRRYYVPLVKDPQTGDLIPAHPDPPPPFEGIPRQSEVTWVDIVPEWIDTLSVIRHGDQLLEIDGLVYGALGRIPTDESTVQPTRSRGHFRRPPSNTPADQFIVPATYHAEPVTGDIEDETGWQLGFSAANDLLLRYAYGAPSWKLPVTRARLRDERVGSWVVVNLSWMPDYETGRRNLFGLAQITSLGELDCAWRSPTLELVVTDES